MLPESPGSIAEAAFYGPENASKIIVFAENRSEEREGFAGKVYARLKVESVEPEEWKTCKTVLKKAHDFAEMLRVEKYKVFSSASPGLNGYL